MAYLKDLVKPGVKAKVKRNNITTCTWDGAHLWEGFYQCVTSKCVLFNDDWELDEPTVDDVLKERGYVIEKTTDCSTQCGFTLIKKSDMCCGPNCNWLHLKTKPETVAELNRILDFMETLK